MEIIKGSGGALKYINPKLTKRGIATKTKDTFLIDVRGGKVDHFAQGEGATKRYEFTAADLDEYITWLATPKGERFQALPEKKSRFGWFGLNE